MCRSLRSVATIVTIKGALLVRQRRQSISARRAVFFLAGHRAAGDGCHQPQGPHPCFGFLAHRNRAAGTRGDCGGEIAMCDGCSIEDQPRGNILGLDDGEHVGSRHVTKSVLYKHEIRRQAPNGFEAAGSIKA